MLQEPDDGYKLRCHLPAKHRSDKCSATRGDPKFQPARRSFTSALIGKDFMRSNIPTVRRSVPRVCKRGKVTFAPHEYQG